MTTTRAIEDLKAEIERLEGSELGLNRYLATVQSQNRELRAKVSEFEIAQVQLTANELKLTGKMAVPDDFFFAPSVLAFGLGALSQRRARGYA